MERFSLKKLNEVEVKKQYRVEISDKFAALENAEVDINRVWETLAEECYVGFQVITAVVMKSTIF
jgi:hypothetical protein